MRMRARCRGRGLVLHVMLAVAVLGGAAAASAQGLESAPIGTVVKDVGQLGQRQFPLLDGDWILASRSMERSTGDNASGGNEPLVSVALVQLEKGRVKRSVFVRANLQPSRNGWARARAICDRKDTHHAVSDRKYSDNDVECWTVNHYGQTLGPNALGAWVDYYRFTDDKQRPMVAIGIDFYLVRYSDFLDLRYSFNPEFDGFPRPDSSDWRGSPWHRDSVAADPKRLAYIEAMKREGERLLPLVRKGFDRELRARP